MSTTFLRGKTHSIRRHQLLPAIRQHRSLSIYGPNEKKGRTRTFHMSRTDVYHSPHSIVHSYLPHSARVSDSCSNEGVSGECDDKVYPRRNAVRFPPFLVGNLPTSNRLLLPLFFVSVSFSFSSFLVGHYWRADGVPGEVCDTTSFELE